MSSITTPMLDKWLCKTSAGLVKLVKHVHFENASNCNVRADISHPQIIERHDGTNWKYDQKKEILYRIVNNSHRLMYRHFESHTQRLGKENSRSMFNYICDWFDKMEKLNHSAYADAMEKVYNLILNESNTYRR